MVEGKKSDSGNGDFPLTHEAIQNEFVGIKKIDRIK